MRLTTAARTLLAHGDTLAAHWERARADLAAHAAVVVSQAMDRLRRDYPAVRLYLRETRAGPARSFDLLATDDTDIAVVVATPDIPPASDMTFDQEVLYDEPLDMLVWPEHPVVGRPDVALSELASDP
ncbi:MAG: LysR substrate-binding domain-containing protein [Actinopolymorphaceae bacterium]